ncbi:hypothetical protein HaLaN_06559 [Haematococcus lacustris]|uniref:Uncharacterized protein n=1 Tax=Haematococcus lacustris TaxID=44745 RepID=A0A699YLG4_HAELA|nr:hypothetical protein HaLaN_06559 [Haematococcus lacustris]
MFSSVDDLDPRPAKAAALSGSERGGGDGAAQEFKLEDSPEAIIICIVKLHQQQ